jgi:hypothetical protein
MLTLFLSAQAEKPKKAKKVKHYYQLTRCAVIMDKTFVVHRNKHCN